MHDEIPNIHIRNIKAFNAKSIFCQEICQEFRAAITSHYNELKFDRHIYNQSQWTNKYSIRQPNYAGN